MKHICSHCKYNNATKICKQHGKYICDACIIETKEQHYCDDKMKCTVCIDTVDKW
jgi:hypothetical protein